MNACPDTLEMLEALVLIIKGFSGYEAVGIRILDKQGGIPYAASQGFSREFLEKENPLNIERDVCFCINVITGKIGTGQRFVTPGGTFFSGSTGKLLKDMPKVNRKKVRNVCHDSGYESIILVPIHFEERILGLIHLADRRENLVSPQLVESLETMAYGLGTAIRRQRLEARLLEAEDRYMGLFHLGSEVEEAIVVLQDIPEMQGKQILFSDAWPRLTGYSGDELKGISFFDLVHEEDRAASLSRHNRKISGESVPGLYEINIVRKNGIVLPLEITGAFASYKGKRANVVYIRDISRRRQSEASLREREMLFRGIYEGSPLGIELYDGDGKLIMANEACLEIFGASESSAIGFPLFDDPNLPEEARQKLRLGQVVRFESKFDFGEVKKTKLYATTKRGQIDIDVVIAPLAFDGNNRWGYLVQVKDITSQKKMQRKLKESEILYRTLFKATGSAISIIDERGYISLVNDEWCKSTGYMREEAENRIRAIDLVDIRDKEKALRYFNSRKIGIVNTPGNYECRLVAKDDRIFEALINVNMIPGTAKRIASYVDISPIRKIERELTASERHLRLLSHRLLKIQEEERTRIARDLHDLMAQELAAIKLTTDSLSRRLGQTDLKPKADELVALCDRLIRTTHKISVDLRPEMLDRLGLFKAVQWYAESFERQTGISCPVESKVPEINLINLGNDKAIAIFRIFQEAMTNVLRHARASEVQICFTAAKTGLSLRIKDDGIGMKPGKTDSREGIGLLGMR
ncbi:MAG TPA: hypothetical protein DCR95_10120, partial [Desulfobacter sp.]|nr:hypothetical protein [Desulfobacter sp.]